MGVRTVSKATVRKAVSSGYILVSVWQLRIPISILRSIFKKVDDRVSGLTMARYAYGPRL